MPKAHVTLTGKIKWWNSAKGFGFIIVGGIDYFVHYKSIKVSKHDDQRKDLQDGQLVSFVPEKGPRGLQALEVEAIEPDGNTRIT